MAVLGHGLPNLEDACRSVKGCLSKVDCFWRLKTEVQKPVHVGEETCDNPRGLVPKEGQTEVLWRRFQRPNDTYIAI